MELFIEVLKAVVYGVIEGVTEWLPISSTGHMILAEQVLKFQFSEAFMSMFRVVIQLGAILAVLVLYIKKLWPFCVDNGRDSGFGRHFRWPVVRLWCKIIVACLPAAVLGFLLDDWLDAHLYNSITVAAMLIIYGIAFIIIERRPRPPRTTKLSHIGYKQALQVGAWQVLSMIPGTSRSGATILGGMLCGLSRPCASQFTFFLAIPVMAGASGLKLVKFFLEGNALTGAEILVLLVGCVVAFLVSMLAIRFLMDYVKRHTFTVFGWYRIALGAVVLIIWLVQTFVLKTPAAPAAA
nr:undecaprenyl-diphosphate phosphatase [uncultured Gemmiger sp.]